MSGHWLDQRKTHDGWPNASRVAAGGGSRRRPASGPADEWRTTSSLIGESKYGDNFQHYDYVNPDAPKGGTLNSVVSARSTASIPTSCRARRRPALPAFGGGLLYDTLMEQATDEGSTSHPLIADAYKYPDDYSSATYRLDPRAKWHDGQPITADDVIWSFQVLKANSPHVQPLFRECHRCGRGLRPRGRVPFQPEGQPGTAANPRRPRRAAQALVGRHRCQRQEARHHQSRRWSRRSAPAAYKIASFKPGSEIVWQRVPDYWGAKLPVKIGRENFDTQRFTYFLDDNAAWQAFTKGGFEDISARKQLPALGDRL